MQITGQNTLSVDPATAWAAFHDAGVLQRSLPGCQSLKEIEPGRYAMTVSAGVAAIKGTYDGEAAFSQENALESFVLSLSGAGGPGTVDADVKVDLSASSDGGTTLDWTADATVGGPVGGVGQRMLSSVAKRLATQFFKNIDADIAAGGSAAAAGSQADAETAVGMPSAGSSDDAPAPSVGGASAGGAPVRAVGPVAAARPASPAEQLVPMAAGAAIALIGVALGSRLRRG